MSELRRHMMMQAQGGGGLPSEYQQVEYLLGGSTHNAYIDTQVFPTKYTRISFDAQVVTNNALGWLFGARENYSMFCLAWNRLTKQWIFGWHIDIGNNHTPTPAPDFNRHTFELDMGKCYIDNVLLHTYSISVSADFRNQSSVYLFSGHGSGTQTPIPEVKVYHTSFYENGTPIRDMYPCYRKSDNVAGMYDIVNNVFYTNVGSGSFTVGPDI